MSNRQDYFGRLDELFNQLFKDPTFISNSGFNIYPETFPPANIILKQNKDLVFEFAIAGYTQNDIDLSFEGDSMVIEFKKIPDGKDEKDVYLSHNIKTSGKKSKYLVPYTKYATEKSTAVLKDGILRVSIPAKDEERPRKVKIEF